jgi:uncharacterized protein YjbI with pentapeptide repeats
MSTTLERPFEEVVFPELPAPSKCAFSNREYSCIRIKQDGSNYCIGHDAADKDSTRFFQELAAELNDQSSSTINLESWIFPGGELPIDLTQKEIAKPLSLKGAIFKGDVFFDSTKFKEGVDFQGAVFKGESSFRATEFGTAESSGLEGNSFKGARFKKLASFEGAKVFTEIDFGDAVFSDELKLDDNTDFQAKASFNGAEFRRKVTLDGAHFTVVDFSGAVFTGESRFIKTIFQMTAVFEQARFIGVSNFSDAEFRGAASFVDSKFKRSVLFKNTRFFPDAATNFDRAVFAREVSFENTDFDRLTYFSETEFAGPAGFACSFKQNADFTRTFFGDVDFADAKFHQDAKFERTRFRVGRMTKVEFCGQALFERPQLQDRLVLERVNFGKNTIFNLQVSARNVLIIRNSDLSQIQFGGSNIENVDFENVTWKQVRFKRLGIADEPIVKAFSWINADLKRKLQDARLLYRQLRINHDKSGEYENAGKFYISESEMSYKLLPPVIRWIHPRGLYKRASRYGESIVQATIVLFVLLFLFSFVYWVGRPIWFTETPKMLGASHLKLLTWWEAVWLSLQASKPLADLGLYPMTWLYWLAFAEGIIVPTQVGLFLLAVRRRFRRGD